MLSSKKKSYVVCASVENYMYLGSAKQDKICKNDRQSLSLTSGASEEASR
jgi:hypothetical protein